MNKKLLFVNKLYPLYSGLSSDLIFYIAINTIWLTTVKGFNSSQITFLFTISSLASILIEIPSLMIIKKIGNTKSIRLSSFLLFLSSIMVTFCNKYIFFAIADILLKMSNTFGSMSSILIKNNLEYQNKSFLYVKIRSNSSVVYALATALITLFIGILFNINNYLPMILGIIVCFICLILSFFIFDIDDIKNTKKNSEKSKMLIPKPLKKIFLIVLFYGIIFGIICIGQQDCKLLIQYELNDFFNINKVVIYLGIILFISRLIRIIINYLYPKIYNKIKDKIGILMIIYFFVSIVFILIGYYLNVNFYLKFLFLTLGFSSFPSLREPIKIYSQNLVLNKFDKKYYKDCLVYLSLFSHIGEFIFSLFASFMLFLLPIQYLFICFLISLFPFIYISFKISD